MNHQPPIKPPNPFLAFEEQQLHILYDALIDVESKSSESVRIEEAMLEDIEDACANYGLDYRAWRGDPRCMSCGTFDELIRPHKAEQQQRVCKFCQAGALELLAASTGLQLKVLEVPTPEAMLSCLSDLGGLLNPLPPEERA